MTVKMVSSHINKSVARGYFYHFLFNQLINKAKTAIWLTVKAKITDIVPETFKTVAEGFKESMRIIFDDFLGKLNDKTIPLQS